MLFFTLALTLDFVHAVLKRHERKLTSAQYFAVALFIMWHKVLLSFESVNEILKPKVWPFKCKLLSSTFPAVLFRMAVFSLEDEQIVWTDKSSRTDKSSQTDKSSDVKAGRTNLSLCWSV